MEDFFGGLPFEDLSPGYDDGVGRSKCQESDSGQVGEVGTYLEGRTTSMDTVWKVVFIVMGWERYRVPCNYCQRSTFSSSDDLTETPPLTLSRTGNPLTPNLKGQNMQFNRDTVFTVNSKVAIIQCPI
jgi:hypothetical protein